MATLGQAVPGTNVIAGALVIPAGAQGVPGEIGATGATGPGGAKWWHGAGPPPSPVVGANPGDYYIDTVTSNVYQL